MKPFDQGTTGENKDAYTPDYEKYAKSYPELCSEFLTTLAKAIKNTALYTLSHPVVLESLRKNCAILGMMFDANKETEVTLSFANDSWLFNETPVPAVTQESHNLNAFFRAHRIQGLTFVDGVQPFEVGALCEFLSAQDKNRPAGYIEEFFAAKDVTNIRTEAVHYVKDGGYSPQSQSYRGAPEAAPAQQQRPAAQRPAQQVPPLLQPRPAAARPVPEIFPELEGSPAANKPAPAALPAQQPRPAAARPAQQVPPAQQQARTAAARPAGEMFPELQTRPAPDKPAPSVSPSQQPRPAPARPAQETPQAQQPRPAAVRPPQEAKPARQEAVKAGPDAMFGTAPLQGTAAPAGRAKPAQDQGSAKTDIEAMFAPGPGPGTAGGPGGAKAGEGPGGGKAGEGPGGGKAGEGPGGGKAGEGPGGGKEQETGLANMSFGGILKGLVESTVKDPKDRVHAYEDAMKMLKETMEQQIAESTRALAAEKEQALNTRARTERVLSKVADGKVIVDKDGKILMMNPAAEEIAGTKLSDAVGRHISEHLRPGEHFLTMSKDMDMSGGKIVSGEVEVSGDETMGRTLRRSVAMLVDAEGRVVGELSTMPELTKYKEMQRMQEEFLSRVTHDLQSPLSSITSALEMLNDAALSKLDPVENKFLDISIRNSHRLSQMIRGILDFSKLQSGKMDIHPIPTPLDGMLREAVEGLMPWARTKGITLSLRPLPEGLCALADAPRIVQVVTNLISNAIKATPEGGTVTVAASPNPDQEGEIVVGVRDNGNGIPKEDLNKIFEKFVQLASRKSSEGVGLGLAIVSDFLRLHNGRIWAASEVGKGSTFYFTLPLAEKSCAPYDYRKA